MLFNFGNLWIFEYCVFWFHSKSHLIVVWYSVQMMNVRGNWIEKIKIIYLCTEHISWFVYSCTCIKNWWEKNNCDIIYDETITLIIFIRLLIQCFLFNVMYFFIYHLKILLIGFILAWNIIQLHFDFETFDFLFNCLFVFE